jgi:hypothetical protein
MPTNGKAWPIEIDDLGEPTVTIFADSFMSYRLQILSKVSWLLFLGTDYLNCTWPVFGKL